MPFWLARIYVAVYRYNKSSSKLEVEILVDKWREYVNNKRYKLMSPTNVEVDTKVIDIASLLSGKKQDSNERCKYRLLRLGSRQSDSYVYLCTPYKKY